MAKRGAQDEGSQDNCSSDLQVDDQGYVDLGFQKLYVGTSEVPAEELEKGLIEYNESMSRDDFPELYEPWLDAIGDFEAELTEFLRPYVVKFRSVPHPQRQELSSSTGILRLVFDGEEDIYLLLGSDGTASKDLAAGFSLAFIVADAWTGLNCIRELIQLNDDGKGYMKTCVDAAESGRFTKIPAFRNQSQYSLFELIAANAFRLGRIVERVRVYKHREAVLSARTMKTARQKGGMATAVLSEAEWKSVIAERKRLTQMNPHGGAKERRKADL